MAQGLKPWVGVFPSLFTPRGCCGRQDLASLELFFRLVWTANGKGGFRRGSDLIFGFFLVCVCLFFVFRGRRSTF